MKAEDPNKAFWDSIPMTITYVGEILKGEWQHDLWRCELKGKQGYHCFDYKTGLGLRGRGKYWPALGKVVGQHPVKPSIADVMHSLLLDADCTNQSFQDWCDEYGYNSDSIKDLNIYKACCDTAVALRKYLTREQIETARKLTEDM